MLLKKYVLVRRLKQDVLTDLRPKTRTVIVTSVHDKALAENIRSIANLKQIIAAQIAGGTDAATAAASANKGGNAPKKAITQLYADTGLAKLPFIVSYLEDLLEAGTKFLIFAHHLAVLDGIEHALIKAKAGYFRLDGSTKPADRQAGVERFQTDRKRHNQHAKQKKQQQGMRWLNLSLCVPFASVTASCRIALLSITAGGTGITLTAASTVVFAELQWTPALLCQAEDRGSSSNAKASRGANLNRLKLTAHFACCFLSFLLSVHRIGQFNPVNIYYLVAHHTLDEILWPMLSNKLEVLGQALNGREDALEVSGVHGDSAKDTPITFKKAALLKPSLPLATAAAARGKQNKAEVEDLTEEKNHTTGRQQQSNPFRGQFPDDSVSASSPAATVAPKKSAPFSGWIGMSGGGAKKDTPAAASAPLRPAAAASSSSSSSASLAPSTSVARMLHREAVLDAEWQSTQHARRMRDDLQDDVSRFDLPREEDGAPSASLADAAAAVARAGPPPDAVISFDISDSDEFRSEEEEEEDDPEVLSSVAVRKQLQQARKQQQ